MANRRAKSFLSRRKTQLRLARIIQAAAFAESVPVGNTGPNAWTIVLSVGVVAQLRAIFGVDLTQPKDCSETRRNLVMELLHSVEAAFANYVVLGWLDTELAEQTRVYSFDGNGHPHVTSILLWAHGVRRIAFTPDEIGADEEFYCDVILKRAEAMAQLRSERDLIPNDDES